MKLGGLIGIGLVAGAAVAAYAYYKKYKKYHEDLEDDFKEFEDEDSTPEKETFVDPNKKYTSLNANKEELVDAAKATLETAKGMVPPAKHMVKDIAEIVSEKGNDASIIANDRVTTLKERVNSFIDNTREKVTVVEEDAFDDYEDETKDDVIIDIDASGNIKKDAR